MNELQKAFCDGAEFALLDTANELDRIISAAPKEFSQWLECLAPLSEALRRKAVIVREERERFMGSRH